MTNIYVFLYWQEREKAGISDDGFPGIPVFQVLASLCNLIEHTWFVVW